MRNSKKMKKTNTNVGLEHMDDEDIFHKQRDKIPLSIDDDSEESDDDELPVFERKGSEEDDSEEDDEEDEEEDEDDEEYDKSLAKIEKTQKYLKAKHGNLEDDLLDDDDEEDKEEQRTVWGRAKSNYHNADNVDFELQSDEDSAEEEEAEAIRLRKETAKSMTMDDFGIEDDENSESDAEPTIGDMIVKKKDITKKKDTEGSHGITFEEVKKDLSSLSKDEQMDVVSSSAPELVGLLSELNDALSQLDQINPLVSKVKLLKDNTKKAELHYLEVKKLLLLAYSQAITFYLLLKSEGQPVRDHPVISRLVEIKSLLEKIKVLDENLPSDFEVLLNEIEVDVDTSSAGKDTTTVVEQPSDSNNKKQQINVVPKAQKLQTVETPQVEVQNKQKRPKEAVSSQSMQMLSARAALEEKLKRKGMFTTLESNSQMAKKQKSQRHNSQLETLDDFGDDAVDVEGNTQNGHPSLLTNKISQIITTKGNKKVSGDDDLPTREDLGERRRRHELRVLAGAGVDAMDDGGLEEDDESGEEEESDDELTNSQKSKLATKNPIGPATPLESDIVDGKRLITQQIEKNRGLTPHRKKLTKNPRKKYKLKHEKAKKRLGGQVRQVRKPQGPYGGESTGINTGVSRSIRFKG